MNNKGISNPEYFGLRALLFEQQQFVLEAYLRGLPTGFWTKDQANKINRLLEVGVLQAIEVRPQFRRCTRKQEIAAHLPPEAS